jgi:hypothetical protein
MHAFFKIALLLFTTLLLSGCLSSGHYPPERPVAYMYPSVMRAQNLSLMKGCPADESAIEAKLDELGVRAILEQYGLVRAELQTIARGIRNRGYAELDCRRTKCPVRFVIFFSLDGKTIQAEAMRTGGEMLRTDS